MPSQAVTNNIFCRQELSSILERLCYISFVFLVEHWVISFQQLHILNQIVIIANFILIQIAGLTVRVRTNGDVDDAEISQTIRFDCEKAFRVGIRPLRVFFRVCRKQEFRYGGA